MNSTDTHNALSSLYGTVELLSYYDAQRLRSPVMRDQLALYLYQATGAYNNVRGQLNAIHQVLSDAHARLYAAQYEQAQPAMRPQQPTRTHAHATQPAHRRDQQQEPER